jgi:hypothetical protein
MSLTATLQERLAAQAVRRELGLPPAKGDLVWDGLRFVEVIDAASAGECIEARTNKEIRAIRREGKEQR